MSLSKVLTIFIGGLFLIIGFAAIVKKKDSKNTLIMTESALLNVIPVDLHPDAVDHSNEFYYVYDYEEEDSSEGEGFEEGSFAYENEEPPNSQIFTKEQAELRFAKENYPLADAVNPLFTTHGVKYPFVETITYHNRVPWKKSGPAWISDYASHFATSRHFIARSLNGAADYKKQDVRNGDQFNVFSLNKNIEFNLVIDILTCHLWLYVIDLDANEHYLLKTYKVCLGKEDPSALSGIKTPLGTYELGDKIAVYEPKTKAFYKSKMTEMISVFGTRWIPFAKEVGECTASARGFGIHGMPYKYDAKGNLEEDRTGLGGYESDGCIRLATEDIEELFSIVITKPTTVQLVKGFKNAELKGREVRI